jgi:phosphoribosylformylglycinamidine cyclo-ligase
VGGETAEMPGFYSAGDYDLAGFCIGVVEKNSIITGEDIKVGHRLVGLPSSGPHSNGFSLIRRIVEVQGSTDPTLIDQLMTPTRIYARPVLQLLEDIPVAGMSHITGGGLLENLPRMFRDPDLAALVDRDAWRWPDVFAWLQQAGNVDETEMLRTFNCGIGFVVCVAESDVEATLAGLTAAGEEPVVIGEVVAKGAEVPAGRLLIG